MTTWIQSSDFSSQDIADLANFQEFVSYFKNLPIEQFDAVMQQLETSGSEFCPWGIGINMDTGHGMHVCREDVFKNTYMVTIQKTVKVKIFGLIPVSKNNEQSEYGLSDDQMKQVAAGYYEVLQ